METCVASNSTLDFRGCDQAYCLGLADPAQQVTCSAQNLNIYEPPSVYDFSSYAGLWQPITCLLWNVSYADRQELTGTLHDCSVPLSGADAFLFASLALVAAGVLFGNLSSVWLLVVGGALGGLNYAANLRQASNSIALWLGVSPPDIFFYAFMPPLAVDAALRLDMFMFKKLWVPILMNAFVLVSLSALLLTVLILYVMDFRSQGWSWVHGALFSAMIASTDAIAVTGMLKTAGGPERIVTLVEGEALLNDASAITLFKIFLGILNQYSSPPGQPWPSVWSVLPTVLGDTARLAAIGLGVGLGLSWATGYLLRLVRWRGARPYVETTIVMGLSFLAFYVANSPAKGSGVIAVVVYGLYGNATAKWGMLGSAEESGAFDAVWDMVSFAANGIVFFWSGISSVNFLVRSADVLGRSAWSFGAIPIIYIFATLVRAACVVLFNPLFKLLGAGLVATEIVFLSWAGLRGSVSLIMIADFINQSTWPQGTSGAPYDEASYSTNEQDVVNADISLWTAAFVVLTLLINAPLIKPMISWLGLNRISGEKLKGRRKAQQALADFTQGALARLQQGEDDLLRGASWDAVAAYVEVAPPAEKDKGASGAKTQAAPTQSRLAGAWSRLMLALWPWGRRGQQPPGPTSTAGATVGEGSFQDGSSAAAPQAAGSAAAEDSSGSGRHKGEKSPSGEAMDEDEVSRLLWELPFLPGSNSVTSGTPAVGVTPRVSRGAPEPTAAEADLRAAPPPELSAYPSPRPSEGDLSFSNAWKLQQQQQQREQQQQQQQPAEPGSAGGSSHGGSSIAAAEDLYYSTLPARLGYRLQAQLQRALQPQPPAAVPMSPSSHAAQQCEEGMSGMAAPGPPAFGRGAAREQELGGSGSAAGTARPAMSSGAEGYPTGREEDGAGEEGVEEEGSAYYSSLPVASRGKLLRELQQQLQRVDESGPSVWSLGKGRERSEIEAAAAAAGAAAAAEAAAMPVEVAAVPALAPAHDNAAAAGQEQQRFPGGASGSGSGIGGGSGGSGAAAPPPEYYSSVPAQAGRRLRQELEMQLRLQQWQQQQQAGGTQGAEAGSGQSQPGPRLQHSRSQESLLRRMDAAAAAAPAYNSHLHSARPNGLPRASLPRPPSGKDLLGRPVGQAGGPLARLRLPGLLHQTSHNDGSSGWQPARQTVALGPLVGPAATPLASALQRQRSLGSPTGSTSSSSWLLPSAPFGLPGLSLQGHRRLPSDLSSRHLLRRSATGAGGMSGAADRAWRHPSVPHQAPFQQQQQSDGVVVLEIDRSRATSPEPQLREEQAKGGIGMLNAGVMMTKQRQLDMGISAAVGGAESQSATEGAGAEPSPEALGEMRARLVAGLRRHLHRRWLEGMLSTKGLRVLDYACEEASEHLKDPLGLWSLLEHEIKGGMALAAVARILLWLARSYQQLPQWGRGVFGPPIRLASGWLRGILGRKLLVACEVALEYHQGLLHTAQAHSASDRQQEGWPLLPEVEQECDLAHRFIIAREVEAPDRFTAIQSYRAAMGLLRQQLAYVQQLFEAGMVDSAEKETMEDPIDRRRRHLEMIGPVWKPPRSKAVLQSLPFMSGIPSQLFSQLWVQGSIREFLPGQRVGEEAEGGGSTEAPGAPGMFVVLSGAVKTTYSRPGAGEVKEYYQGTGAVVGVLPALTGTWLPGSEVCLAEGNALGKGPMLFHFPQLLMEKLRAQGCSPEAPPGLRNLVLELHRLAAMHVAASLEAELAEELAQQAQQAQLAAAAKELKEEEPSLAKSLAEVQLAARQMEAADSGADFLAAARASGALWAAQVVWELRQRLPSSQMVQLAPGGTLRQLGHLVLLRGSLAPIPGALGRHAQEDSPLARMPGTAAHAAAGLRRPAAAPCVLPWLPPTAIAPAGGAVNVVFKWKAGRDGALVMVCTES